MARRSAMNKRYQKDAKVGSTRKSAATAKPKRSNAGPAQTSSAKKSPSSRGGSSGYQRVVLPPDIKRLQKISFALLGVAVVISVLYLWKGQQLGLDARFLIGIAYACMFTALYIDLAKVRPVLKALRRGDTIPEKSSGSSASKDSKKADEDKPDSGKK